MHELAHCGAPFSDSFVHLTRLSARRAKAQGQTRSDIVAFQTHACGDGRVYAASENQDLQSNHSQTARDTTPLRWPGAHPTKPRER